jgi:AcrR family transcriptional regulator
MASEVSPRKRLAPEDRERIILDGAIAFFAEVGFEGTTRDLAARLSITQPLLYRYFPTKEILLDRVYQKVYLSKWDPRWESEIVDREIPIDRRLTHFYTEYARVILTYEWVRLFMFAGLKGLDFNTRYLEFLRNAIFDRVVREMRAAYSLPDQGPPTAEETELVWGLHAAIYYLGVRRWIYRLATPADQEADIALRIKAFLKGAPAALASRPGAA